MSREELILALTKAKGELRGLALEKSKTGNAKEYRTTRRNVARTLTALRAQELSIGQNKQNQ